VCDEDEADSQWIKLKFSGIEELDNTGNHKGNMPSVNNLASNVYTTRTLSRQEFAEISTDYNYDVEPSAAAEIAASLSVSQQLINFRLTVFYFDEESSVSWSDSDTGESRSYNIPENSVKFNIELEGEWPWSGDDHSLKISLDILWATGGDAEISDDEDGVKVDVSSDSLEAYLSFPAGSLSPLTVDGEWADANVEVENRGSHVTVDLIIPHFRYSAVYDPSIVMNAGPGLQLSFFSCLVAVFYYLVM